MAPVSVFDCPYLYLLGMDTPGLSDDEVRDYNDFYDRVHGPEVVAHNPGFVAIERFERDPGHGQGGPGPRWLSVYGIADQASVASFLASADGPPNPNYTPRPPSWSRNEVLWRHIWRRLGVHGPADRRAGHIRIEGMASAGGAGADAYELVRELRHPAPGAPPHLAIRQAPTAVVPTAGGGDPLWQVAYRRLEA